MIKYIVLGCIGLYIGGPLWGLVGLLVAHYAPVPSR